MPDLMFDKKDKMEFMKMETKRVEMHHKNKATHKKGKLK